MANTYSLISKVVLANNADTINFTNIPSTFNDLVLRTSARMTYITSRLFTVNFNTIDTTVYGFETTTVSSAATTTFTGALSSSTSGIAFSNAAPYGQEATNLFGRSELYIHNYSGSSTKYFLGNSGVIPPTISLTAAGINNVNIAGFWNGTSVISSITLYGPGSPIQFAAGSVFWLYGIKNT